VQPLGQSDDHFVLSRGRSSRRREGEPQTQSANTCPTGDSPRTIRSLATTRHPKHSQPPTRFLFHLPIFAPSLFPLLSNPDLLPPPPPFSSKNKKGRLPETALASPQPHILFYCIEPATGPAAGPAAGATLPVPLLLGASGNCNTMFSFNADGFGPITSLFN